MNNSDTPTGESGKKDLKFKGNELKVKKDVTKEDLAAMWETFMKEKGYDYHSLHLEYMSFEVPNMVEKDRVGDENGQIAPLNDVFENVESNSVEVIRLDTFTRASGLPSKNEENAKAYDKERDKAKKLAEKNRDIANEKIETEKKNSAGGTEKPSSRDGR